MRRWVACVLLAFLAWEYHRISELENLASLAMSQANWAANRANAAMAEAEDRR